MLMAIGQIQEKSLIRNHDLTKITWVGYGWTVFLLTLSAHTMVDMAMIKCPEGTRGNIRDMGQKSSNKSCCQSYLRTQLCTHVLLLLVSL